MSDKATLSRISATVERDMKAFNAEFRRSMISDVALVNLVAKYIIRTKGKQVRPMLVLLAAQAAGSVNEATYRAATFVELLHTATLVHDDVIDEAETRRGFASVKALWRNKVGVLMGDYLLAQGLLLAVKSSDYHFLEITSNAVRRMSEGELYQLQKARQLNTVESDYFRIIADKTASLLSTCCELGAASAFDNPTMMQGPDQAATLVKATAFRTALRDYGEAVGIAFQIRDDLFDYLAAESTIGKPVAIDLKEKKMTLPLIYALSKASPSERKRIVSLVRSGKAAKESLSEVMAFVAGAGGIEYARTMAEKYSDDAKRALSVLPDSSAKTALEQFARFVIEREK